MRPHPAQTALPRMSTSGPPHSGQPAPAAGAGAAGAPVGRCVSMAGDATPAPGRAGERQRGISEPIWTVRSGGSPKYSTGLAALRATAANSRLRHSAIPGPRVGWMSMWDRK